MGGIGLPASSGMNNGPFWPQAASNASPATTAPRAIQRAAGAARVASGVLGARRSPLATMRASANPKDGWHAARAVRGGVMSGIGEIMNESEFVAAAEAIIGSIEAQADVWFDELDVDLECERRVSAARFG